MYRLLLVNKFDIEKKQTNKRMNENDYKISTTTTTTLNQRQQQPENKNLQ